MTGKPMNLEKIEQLIELARKHGVHEIKVSDDEIRVTLTPPGGTSAPTYMPQQHMYQPTHTFPQAPVSPSIVSSAPEASVAATVAVANVPAGKLIRSPFVGTFYRSSSPGSDSFVEVGTRVKKGDTLCIVEAMKLMNEIESEAEGVVKEILVDNEDPVEYDQPLFVLE